MIGITKRTLLGLATALCALPFAGFARGQALDEYGDQPEQQADVIQTVARVSQLEGTASYARGDQPDDWQAADVNLPMTLGDRLYTGDRSRLELGVHGGDSIWIGSRTDLAALNLTEDTKQFALKLGVASFHVRKIDDNAVWEIDTPNAAVTFESAGDYRIRVDADGNTRVAVERGNLTVSAGGGQIAVNTGEEMVINGIDSPRYDIVSFGTPDSWDRWVTGRADRARLSASYRYVSPEIVGAADLDDYGSWSNIPQYGNVWSPARVEVGWTPYRQGHWVWQDPWGWTWISTEPWGWAPYHYGRWVNYASRWCWVPVAPAVRVVAYSPALVAFVGDGPGFSVSATIGGGGYVGWFPLAPLDPFVPWWSRRPAVNVNVTNVTYVNQTYVTVVNQNTFVSGGLVARNVVTDRTVVRQVVSAGVVRGAVPVLPTVASTRVSVRTQAAVAPPAAVVARSVVARVAPPPAPPRFQQKLESIRENRRPVDPYAAARLTAQAQPRSAVPIRPVANEGGKVTLAPRQGASAATAARANAAPAPVAAAPVRGRPVATAQQPVASEPVTSRKTADRVRAEPARPEASRAQPGQPATEARPAPATEREPAARPNPNPANPPSAAERERELQRQPTPQARPETERQRVPVPAQPDERVRPTPNTAERSARPSEPDGRNRQVERPPTPAWRERARPTPREQQPSREATPDRGRAQQDAARERALAQQSAREREQAQQSARERAQAQESAPARPEASSNPREQAKPETPKPQERGRRAPTPKPTPKGEN